METEKKDVGGDITSLDIAPIAAGRQRSRYLAVGTADSTVSLELHTPLHNQHGQLLSLQNDLYAFRIEEGLSVC